MEEHESLLWQRRLAREEGLVVEPSAAAASAAVCKLITEGAVLPDQHVVAVITHRIRIPGCYAYELADTAQNCANRRSGER
jgi:threonine synthase